MSGNRFYPPPPVFIGGRQPYQPKLGLPQSGPTPQAPPIRAFAALLSLVLQSWEPAAYALPQRTQIAPLIETRAAFESQPYASTANHSLIVDSWQGGYALPRRVQIAPLIAADAEPAAGPLKPSPATQSIVLASWAGQPQTFITLSSAALITVDDPPRMDRSGFYSLLDSWLPPEYALPAQSRIASLVPAVAAPSDTPLKPSSVNQAIVAAAWSDEAYTKITLGSAALNTAAADAPPTSRFNWTIIASWEHRQYALPSAAKIAGLVPTPAEAATLVPRSNAQLDLLIRSWDTPAFDLPSRQSAVSLQRFDAPPIPSIALRMSVVRQWDPHPYEISRAGDFAPHIEPPIAPDFAPNRTYNQMFAVIEAWVPPFYIPPSTEPFAPNIEARMATMLSTRIVRVGFGHRVVTPGIAAMADDALTWDSKDPDDALYHHVDFQRECARYRRPGVDIELGTRVRPVKSTGYEYEATAAGRTQNLEPVWPQTIGDTVMDGSVEWTARAISTQSLIKTISGTPSWQPTSPVTATGETIQGLIASAILSGGLDGEDYPLRVVAAFSDGTSMTVPCVLPVRRPTRRVVA